MNDLHEPLELSAPLARRLAPQMCRKDPVTGADCSLLHGFWQYLRLMGLAATPDRHAGFYREAIARVTGDEAPPRVLISGAADYAMLAHVLAAFSGRAVPPELTVLELCETPLYLNTWYAERVGCSIETLRCDILEYSPPASFDAICTHSFLGQFSRERRPELVTAWRRALRPGGLVITVNPLRPTGADERKHFTPEQAQALRAAVLREAGALGVDPQDLARQAESYASRPYGYPLRSREDVQQLFESGGFRIDHLTCGPLASEGRTDVGGPGLRQKDTPYANIVASRV